MEDINDTINTNKLFQISPIKILKDDEIKNSEGEEPLNNHINHNITEDDKENEENLRNYLNKNKIKTINFNKYLINTSSFRDSVIKHEENELYFPIQNSKLKLN